MYENMTYEVILQRMLNRIPSDMDKREGSIIYDALAPAAAELAQLYIQMDEVLNQTFVDTARNDYLSKRCSERGINRQPATNAIVQGEFVPTDINVVGKRFNCGEYNYVVIEGNKLQCETSGSEPNGMLGDLIPIDYINGLESAKIVSILIPGEDTESDDDLRQRYFDSLTSQAYGGNVADYKEKTKLIDGVGGVKVTPVWNGGGTVLLTIIASDYSIPSDVLIENVQHEMTSIAPIGHVVTVEGVTDVSIDIATELTYQDGWDWASSGTYIEEAIDEYFLSLTESWENTDTIIVRISGIEQKILGCPGILDVQNTKLNGVGANLQLSKHEVPVRGGVSDGT